MCGILGFIGVPGALSEATWREAQGVQSHRGPDDTGSRCFRLGEREARLAHQRLSILDLTPAGHQPMGDLATSGLLVFNGEIYNYLELRAELEGLRERFASHGDTEVLLKALCRWGPEQTVQRLNGMWAFAWLEPGGSRLWLSRDRAGEKPLYWHCDEGGLYFASEVKALLTLAGRRFALNLQAVGQFLLQSLVDTGSGSFFSGIEQVPAASLGVVDLSRDPPVPSFNDYWQPHATEEGAPQELDSRIESLRETFLDAVRLRLRSDVPVGILLSGGVDSSAIAAAAHRLVPSDAPLNLLSAVSGQAQFDESPFIERVARHLGRPVTRVSLDEDVGSAQLFGEIESAIWHNDAPIGSLSNVMHRRLMAAARKHGITVVLSGQGADELLCGYKKYLGFHLQHLARSGRYRDAAATAWRFWRNGTVIAQFRLAEAKRYLPSWLRRAQGDLRGPALAGYRPLGLGLPPGADVRARQVADLQALSIPVLTHFEDRMSMAESREVRLPFLDPRLVEMLISMPTELKLRDGWTKYVMRKAIEGWLPPQIVWRKDKQGFVNPEAEWLKRELRDQVLSYFAPDALLFRLGLVDRRALLSRYNVYVRQPPGRGAVWFRDIFNPLALEIWLRRFEPFISEP